MARAGRPLTAAKGGKGRGRPTRAPAAAGAGQASDPSRFAADAAGIEPLGGIAEETATVRFGEASATFEGPGAGDRAREWLEQARRAWLAAQDEH
jgi:hypothetical protein